ncbi:MAG: hypothetical protein EA424_16240 [Planctomycetaceae bacterium]|nr:MAG: hypothetical protein EA424_16240 [Planctomycetaceae bacterium]
MIRLDTESLSMDDKIAAACRDAAEQAIARAERSGTNVIVWRDGQVVRLTAAEAKAELENSRAIKGPQEKTDKDG